MLLQEGWRQTTLVDMKLGSNWRSTISSYAPRWPGFRKVTLFSKLTPKSFVASRNLDLLTFGGVETFLRWRRRSRCQACTVFDTTSPFIRPSNSDLKYEFSTFFPTFWSKVATFLNCLAFDISASDATTAIFEITVFHLQRLFYRTRWGKPLRSAQHANVPWENSALVWLNMSRSNKIFSFPVLDDLAQMGFGTLPFHFRSRFESIFGINTYFLKQD